MNRVAVLIIIF